MVSMVRIDTAQAADFDALGQGAADIGFSAVLDSVRFNAEVFGV